MKIAQLSVLAVLVLAAHGALAQSRSDSRSSGSSSVGSSSSSSGSAPSGGAATDATSVTNAGSLLASDQTVEDTTITTTDPGAMTAPMGEMANTGGEPELMLLAGVLLASGGLLLRRKVGAQSL